MYYYQDMTWLKIQKYLPVENRLEGNGLPKEYFIKNDKYQIHIDHYYHREPKATIIIFHGVGGNGRLLSFIGLPLWRQGYEVICPDMPLYGCTEYKGAVSYDDWIACGIKLVKHFQKPDRPMFLFGLSAGGMLAYQVAAQSTNIAGVIATCILDQSDPEIVKAIAEHPDFSLAAKSLVKAFHFVGGKIKVPMKYVATMKAIANQKELAELLMQDPRSAGAKVTVKFLNSLLHMKILTKPEQYLAPPFLLVHPEQDQWAGYELSKKFYDRMACEKNFYLLSGGGHFPIEQSALTELENYLDRFMKEHGGLN